LMHVFYFLCLPNVKVAYIIGITCVEKEMSSSLVLGLNEFLLS